MRLTSFFFFSSRRRHTRYWRDWSSDVCSSDLLNPTIRDRRHLFLQIYDDLQPFRSACSIHLSGKRKERIKKLFRDGKRYHQAFVSFLTCFEKQDGPCR